MTLEQAMDLLGGRQAREHAERLRTIVEEGEQRRFKHLEDAESRRQKLAEMAIDPIGQEVLWFVVEPSGGGRLYEHFLGRAVSDYNFFYNEVLLKAIRQRFAISSMPGNNARQSERTQIERLESRAQAAFDMSLHEYLRVFLLSRANRDAHVVSAAEMRRMAAGEGDYSRESRDGAAHWLAHGSALPVSTLP